MIRPTARTGLAAGAAVVTVALTAAAFWLSYEHLHDVAAANGLGRSPARAWAWPATVDLFIVAGELLILRASLIGRGMDWWAVTLAASGSLGSIALNVAGVGEGAQPMEYVVAAVPPTAALVAFGALMRQVHNALAGAHPALAAPAPAPAAAVAQPDAPAPARPDAHPAPALAADAPPAPDAHPHPTPDAPAPAASAPAPSAAPGCASPAGHSTDAPAPAPGLVLALHRQPWPLHPAMTARPHPDAHPDPDTDARTRTAPDTDADLIASARALDGPVSLRRLQRELGIGQTRAQRIRAALAQGA